MARNLVCSECGGKMQTGYIAETNVFNRRPFDVARWVEGKPDRSIWWGLSAKGKNQYYVSAYRCERCGFLKFYAGPDHSSEK